jgi:hypothetical protein
MIVGVRALILASALLCGCRSAPPPSPTTNASPPQVSAPAIEEEIVEAAPPPSVEPVALERDPVVVVDVLASGKGRAGPMVSQGDAVAFVAGDCVRRWRAGLKKPQTVACAGKRVDPLNEAALSGDATSLFVVYDHDFQKACGVFRIDDRGQRRIALANPCPDSLAHDGEHVYAAGLESVWRVPVHGGALQSVATFGGGARSLVVRETIVMWAALADDAIIMAPKGGGDMRVVASMHVELLASDDRWLYAIDNREDALWRLDPLESTQEKIGSVPSCTRALAVDGEFVYGLTRCNDDNDDDTDPIWRMRKRGGRAQTLAELPTPTAFAVAGDTVYVITMDAKDCTRLERYAEQVGGAVLGICDPGRWSLRRIVAK